MKLKLRPQYLYLLLLLSVPLKGFAADPPAGFEDPKVLAKVMKGEIVMQDKVSTKTEFLTISRAFFHKVSPEAYAALAVNHAKYPQMFEEVKEGETLHVTDDKTQYDYKLHLEVTVGPFTQDVYPEGKQTVKLAADVISESRIENVITNYQDYIKTATQSTRLIPYQDGILIEDTIHAVLQKPSSASGMIKQELRKFFTEYVEAFKKELQGDN